MNSKLFTGIIGSVHTPLGRLKAKEIRKTELLPVALAARRRLIKPSASILLAVIVLLIICFIIWAGLAEIDSVTRADGKVIASTKTQVIQNLEGGILAELLVSEGDTVEENQLLLRIDATIADAKYQKTKSEYLHLTGETTRLTAEAEGQAPQFPEELIKEAPAVAASEKALFESRRSEFARELDVLERQVFQKRQELAELKEKKRGLGRSLSLLKADIDLNRPLVKSGAVAQTEVLRMERAYADLHSELKVTRLAVPRAESALEEALSRKKAKALEYKSEILTDLSEKEAKLAAVKEIVLAEKDRVRRTEVTSPMRGIVKVIRFNTVGGVIRPGDPIMEIVPFDKTLLVEAKVVPQDVAFLRPGLPAKVKVTAYDPAIYGSLDAKLVEISADSFMIEENRSFFRVLLRTEVNAFTKAGETLPIIPGMTTTVDIITGKKTVLDYILKPIRRGQERALRER